MNNDKKKASPRFNKEICIACTICADICPVGAIDLIVANSTKGFRRYPFLMASAKCTGCFSCERQCPAGAIHMA